MRSKLFLMIVAILVSISLLTFVAWFIWKPSVVYLQGEISADSYKISSQMPGRVDSMLVQKGQKVSKGDLLFVLRSNTVNAKRRQAEALRDAASAQNQKAITGARKQQIDQAFQMWNNAKIQEEVLKKTFDRVSNLYKEGVIASQKFDEVQAQYNAACNTTRMAKAQYDMALEGARNEDKLAAAALVHQAEGGISEVDSYLDDSHQYSPIDGEVSTVVSMEGELVGAGMPVVTLIDMNNVWSVFHVKETMLPSLTVGKKLTALIPAIDREVEMEITYVAPLASYATWTATSASGEFDVKTFEVHAKPVEKNIENLRMGMSVLIDIDSL